MPHGLDLTWLKQWWRCLTKLHPACPPWLASKQDCLLRQNQPTRSSASARKITDPPRSNSIADTMHQLFATKSFLTNKQKLNSLIEGHEQPNASCSKWRADLLLMPDWEVTLQYGWSFIYCFIMTHKMLRLQHQNMVSLIKKYQYY